MQFRLAQLVHDSIVDGPGLRLVVFTQGCPHHCPGCHNPATHDPEGGQPADTDQVLASAAKNPLLEGITLSGGEPFAQAAAMAELARGAHDRGLNVITYTGYTFEELLAGLPQNPDWQQLIAQSDWLIEGPFILQQRTLSLPWRGSRNQRVLNGPASLSAGAPVEVQDLLRL